MNDEQFEIWARIHHRERYDEIRAALERDGRAETLAASRGGSLTEAELAEISKSPDPWALLNERSGVLTDRINVGGGETRSKAVFVGPVFQTLQPPGDEMLEALAVRHRLEVRLDGSSRAFLIAKHGAAPGEEAERLVRSFEATVALDELINRYRLEPAILEHLVTVDGAMLEDLESLDAWIYDEVFEQPLDDPWLGLAPRDVYGALPPEMLAAGE